MFSHWGRKRDSQPSDVQKKAIVTVSDCIYETLHFPSVGILQLNCCISEDCYIAVVDVVLIAILIVNTKYPESLMTWECLGK